MDWMNEWNNRIFSSHYEGYIGTYKNLGFSAKWTYKLCISPG